MMEEQGLYELLGLPGGVQGASHQESDLRKAYRRRALECHPDKRPNDANAAAEFAQLQQAYEVLTDAKARKAYDDLQMLRQQREEKRSHMDAKRRKMVDDLRQREAAFELQKKQKAAEDDAARRLKDEIARIRARNAEKRASHSAARDSLVTEDDKERTLKVSWDLSRQPGYTSQSLKKIFQRFGLVEDVVVLQKKNAKKGNGLVVMESAAAMHAATQATCGELSNPLRVTPMVSKTTETSAPQRQGTPPAAAGAPAPRVVNPSPFDFDSRENSILQKLRRAQERKRTLEKMEETDAKEDEA